MTKMLVSAAASSFLMTSVLLLLLTMGCGANNRPDQAEVQNSSGRLPIDPAQGPAVEEQSTPHDSPNGSPATRTNHIYLVENTQSPYRVIRFDDAAPVKSFSLSRGESLVAISPDLNHVVTKRAKQYSIARVTQEKVTAIASQQCNQYVTVVFHPKSVSLIEGNARVSTWSLEDGKRKYQARIAPPASITPGGNYLIHRDGQRLHFLDLQVGSSAGTIEDSQHSFHALAEFSGDGSMLAAITNPVEQDSLFYLSVYDLIANALLFRVPRPDDGRSIRWLNSRFIQLGDYVVSTEKEAIVARIEKSSLADDPTELNPRAIVAHQHRALLLNDHPISDEADRRLTELTPSGGPIVFSGGAVKLSFQSTMNHSPAVREDLVTSIETAIKKSGLTLGESVDAATLEVSLTERKNTAKFTVIGTRNEIGFSGNDVRKVLNHIAVAQLELRYQDQLIWSDELGVSAEEAMQKRKTPIQGTFSESLIYDQRWPLLEEKLSNVRIPAGETIEGEYPIVPLTW